jgi:hypothetical protein
MSRKTRPMELAFAPMGTIKEFYICLRGGDLRWVVRLGSANYGFYLDKEQAVLDAIEAAQDEQQAGHPARVWLREPRGPNRVIF